MVKEFDLVKLKSSFLKNDTNNLDMAEMGVVLKLDVDNKLQVLFFNSYNKGDYAVASVSSEDVLLVEEKSSEEFKSLVCSFYDKIDYSKTSLVGIKFEDVCEVELVNDRPKYKKFGLKKGDRGFVAIDYAVKNEVLVDFSGNAGLEGENMGLVSVLLNDLQKVK